MSAPAARRYLREAVVIGVATGLALGAAATIAGGVWKIWGPAGWLAATAIGLVAGAALVRSHGSPGWGFVVAMLAGMLARFVALAAGGVWAAWTGRTALVAFVAGFGAGFVPLQVHEAIFLRRGQEASGLDSKVIG
jgi:hypothetical protein